MRTPTCFRGLLVAVPVLLGLGRLCGDEFQWRPAASIRLLQTGPFELFTYNENWLVERDGLELDQYQFSLRTRYHVHTNVSLGLNYTYLESQQHPADGSSTWQDQNRIEFEVTPHWEHPSGFRVSNRNRLEVRWIEDRPDENFRTRHLLELGWPVKLPRPFTGAFSQGEVFYDWSRGRLTEWRASPAGVDIRLCPRASLRLYYTWREVNSNYTWTTSHVFWTVLNLKLQ